VITLEFQAGQRRLNVAKYRAEIKDWLAFCKALQCASGGGMRQAGPWIEKPIHRLDDYDFRLRVWWIGRALLAPVLQS
jgi:hypothetical protein